MEGETDHHNYELNHKWTFNSKVRLKVALTGIALRVGKYLGQIGLRRQSQTKAVCRRLVD